MSDIKIQPSATGSATVTLTAPVTNTARTITFPDSTSTLLASDGSAASLTAIPAANITGTLPAISGANLTGLTSSQMPAGSILQVVTGTDSTALTTSSASYVDLGLSASITPSSTSSKILILAECQTELTQGEGAGIAIIRGSTNIFETTNYHNYQGASGQLNMRSSYTHLDSPSSTSSITYKIQGRVYGGSALHFNEGSNITTITLIEVAG